ncbi:DUF3995 domain-containing protein [Streptomyces atratus]|uniref:DUF3995 domain-containing protein n=1 Tax=Streptomyces atratus TaxID=1893 RepID=UPI002AC32975|nr:DUF3995 domain-containing protein [Streptomyces atratus]WPW31010.1 DUF3995 domain-containing protein [Streptomyces atratus]
MPNAQAATTPASVVPVSRWGRTVEYCAVIAELAATALFRPRGDFLPRWLRIGAALTVGTGLALWGLGHGYLRFFIAVGRAEPSAEVAASFGPWNSCWYPVFLIWGVPMTLAALHLRHRPHRPSVPGTDVPQPDGRTRRDPSTIEVKP